MLKKIHVEHYKAFEKADVPIKPITILLGANSVGKSSIIHLLLSMEQTAMVDSESYSSCLKLFGKAVNMGSADNIFRKFETDVPVELAFTVVDDDLFYIIKDEYKEHMNELLSVLRYFGSFYSRNYSNNKLKDTDYRLIRRLQDSSDNIVTKEDYMSLIKLIKGFFSEKDKKGNRHPNYYLRYGPIGRIIESDNSTIENFYKYLVVLKQLNNAGFDFVFKIKLEEHTTLAIDSFTLSCDNVTLFSYNQAEFTCDPISFSNSEKNTSIIV